MSGVQDHDQPISVGLSDAWAIARMQQGTILGVMLLVMGLTLLVSMLMTPKYLSIVSLELRMKAGQEMKTELVTEEEVRSPGRRARFVQTVNPEQSDPFG